MTIRAAEKKDWPGIKELILHNPKKLMQTHLPKSRSFFVAEVGGRIVGCCALQVYSRRLAEIRSLAVDPGYRRRRIAGKLVVRCVKRANERGVYEILGISGAKRLFEKMGFRIFNQEKYALLKVLKNGS